MISLKEVLSNAFGGSGVQNNVWQLISYLSKVYEDMNAELAGEVDKINNTSDIIKIKDEPIIIESADYIDGIIFSLPLECPYDTNLRITVDMKSNVPRIKVKTIFPSIEEDMANYEEELISIAEIIMENKHLDLKNVTTNCEDIEVLVAFFGEDNGKRNVCVKFPYDIGKYIIVNYNFANKMLGVYKENTTFLRERTKINEELDNVLSQYLETTSDIAILLAEIECKDLPQEIIDNLPDYSYDLDLSNEQERYILYIVDEYYDITDFMEGYSRTGNGSVCITFKNGRELSIGEEHIFRYRLNEDELPKYSVVGDLKRLMRNLIHDK